MLLRKKEEIEAWLNKYHIKKYELIPDEEYGYVVNVNGDVNLYNQNLNEIKIKFNKINGSFWCNKNNLISLEGSPEIVHSRFNCAVNKLKSLKYAPKIVHGSFYCYKNELETLEGGPEIIEGDFTCYHNQLQLDNLKYLPQRIDGCFNISRNINLKELQDITNLKELKIKLEKNHLLKNINLTKLNKKNNNNKI